MTEGHMAGSERGQMLSDMQDDLSDLHGEGRLAEFLRQCQSQLVLHYGNASRKAQNWQAFFRTVAALVAGLGLFGLLCSIDVLTLAALKVPEPVPLPTLEVVCVVAAAGFVVVGLVLSYLKIWLVWRSRAEAYRQLKFRLLVRPGFWAGQEPPQGDWQAWFGRELQAAHGLDRHQLEPLSRQEPLGDLADALPETGVAAADVRALADYYVRRRLAAQTNYFEDRASRKSFWDNPRMLPFFFFGGVACAVAHVILHEGAASFGFLALSLFAPITWAAIRTWRSANEFARNAARSRAKHTALTRYRDALLVVSRADPPDAARLFRLLALSEALLVSEQREWLRLMLDAEWYG
jgi:hypothetical protein